jgi:hypothetical protein
MDKIQVISTSFGTLHPNKTMLFDEIHWTEIIYPISDLCRFDHHPSQSAQ